MDAQGGARTGWTLGSWVFAVVGLLGLLAMLAPAARAQEAPLGEAEIERRLERIFGALERLEGVLADVEEGVVRLSGEVPDAAARDEAQRIAERMPGVVAVENDVREVRAVGQRLETVEETLRDRLRGFASLLPLLGIALLVVAAAWLVARLLGKWDAPYRRLSRNRLLRDVVRQVVQAVVFLAGIVVALEILGATALVGAALGAAGVVGLALGFAFRDLIENYIASILLSLRRPFEAEDHVVIEGHEGKVARLTSRATILMTLDGNHLRIPNATVFKGVIVNYTRNPQRRFRFEVGVAPETNLVEAKTLGAQALAAMEGVLGDPPPSVLVKALGDSTVTLELIGWVDQRRHDFAKVESEARRIVKTAFDRAGIEMPAPGYRLLRAASGPEAATRTQAARAEPSVEQDVSAETHLDQTIRAERAETGAPDLLDPAAPVE